MFKQLRCNSKLEKKFIFAGVLCIGIGLTINEYLLTYLFSEDGVVGLSIRLSIWVFDGLLTGFGLLIILSKPFRLIVTKIELIKDIINYNYFIRVILTVLIAILLFAQISYLMSAIHENQDNQGIIYSIDADAGTNIYGALSAKRGGSLNHGVLYQKVAHYLAWLSPVFNSVDTKGEKNEKKVHFSLVLISLFSLYMFSYLLASLISNETIYKLLGTLLISATLLSESTWCNYTLRVHPDMLLALLSALFIFLIYRSQFKTNSKFSYLACLVAGACLATKPIFFLFLPGLIFIELPPVTSQRVINLIKLYLLIGVSYFILVFPLFFESIKRLVGVRSDMSTTATLESIIGWFDLLITQGWLLLLMIFILFLFSGKNPLQNRERDKFFFLRFWAVAFTPFILLITHKTEFGISHWTLPFVSILLTAFAVWLPHLNFYSITQIRSWCSRGIIKYAMAMTLLISFEMTVGIVPANVDVVLNELMAGRKGIRETYQVINMYADDSKKVLVEAYIPFKRDHDNIVQGGHLSLTLDMFKEFDPDIVAVNIHQMPRIMEGERPNNYEIIGRENYHEIREYYSLFYKKNETVDPWGNIWEKIYEDNRGVQLWEKQ